MPDLCAVVLAAGQGTRLRPLTLLRPKALCPVGNVPLLDQALARMAALGLAGPDHLAVNASWLADQVAAHVQGVAHLSVEQDGPLGTADGLARLRDWIAGRPVLVANSDAYLPGALLEPLLSGWDGEAVRLLGIPGREFGDAGKPNRQQSGDASKPNRQQSGDAGEPNRGRRGGYDVAGCSLLPWRWVRDLPSGPGELVRAVWRPAEAAGALEVIPHEGYFRDTGTLPGYLAANRHAAAAAGGSLIAADAQVTGSCHESVVGAGAVVHGNLVRSVVWPGATVQPGERLTDAVRPANIGGAATGG